MHGVEGRRLMVRLLMGRTDGTSKEEQQQRTICVPTGIEAGVGACGEVAWLTSLPSRVLEFRIDVIERLSSPVPMSLKILWENNISLALLYSKNLV